MATCVPTTPKTRQRVAKPTALPMAEIIAFPPTGMEAAGVADAVEQLPPGKLLPFACNSLILARSRMDEPACATSNMHAVFGAMLALCRVLDAAGYPWDGADRRRMLA